MTRGILSIYWGDESKLPIERLKASVKKFHPELQHEIIKVEAPSGEHSSLNKKAAMLDLSPFDETLFNSNFLDRKIGILCLNFLIFLKLNALLRRSHMF